MYLSIIIPAFNEEKRISNTLSRIHKFLSCKNYDFEVIFVDDGSLDGTIANASSSQLFKDGKLKIVKNGKNMGKGFSVRNGCMHSCGDYVLLSDADLSTPIEELDKCFSYIDKGNDIVIGSRSSAGSEVKIRQPWYREAMGKTFNLFVKSLIMDEFKDTQCGFKLFKGDVARNIASQMKINGFCFDVEMLYLARTKGYNVCEVGVLWENSPESKVRLISSPLSMFLDLLRIKNIHKDVR